MDKWQKDIPSNKHIAERRFIGTMQKLKSIKKFKDEAFKILDHYLPHHPVIKPNNQTKIIRPVFDASCKVGRAPFVNDCLFKGSNLMEHIPAIIVRFRKKDIAVVTDIR